MKKLTLTTLVALGIATGSTVYAGDAVAKKDVRVASVESGKVELTYFSQGECKVKVNIYDEAGSKVFSEKISNPKSFKKAYDLSKLPVGEYEFEIIDQDNVVSETVRTEIEKPAFLRASVIKEDGEKFSVKVIGEIVDPIAVNIYDKNGGLVYGDFIDINKGFSKVYDMSKSLGKDITFEIVQNGEVLAKTSF